MKNEFVSRRGFFGQIAKISGLALLAPVVLSAMPSLAFADERRRGGGDDAAAKGPVLVVPGEGAAKAMNYVDDKSKLTDAKLKADRQGVKWADQKCSGCSFYAAAGKKDGKEVGACSVLAKNLVVANGWCTTWAKKA